MKRFHRVLAALSVLALLASCKPNTPHESDNLSITLPGQVAGKWLATLTIGGGLNKVDSELMANTLRGFFLSEKGGSYKSAFNLSDKSGWRANKQDVVERFSALRASIAEFKAKNPSAPTMVAIGLTGHGASQDVFAEMKEGFVFAVSQGESDATPKEFFTGRELADVIGSLGADEVLVFVQSCNSGRLSNVDFMNKYAQILATETARKKRNIAVVTPVSELIFSPTRGIELAYQKAFDRLASSKTDFVTYAMFKDQLVRAVCELEHDSGFDYYPRSEIKSLAAVKASADLYDLETLGGIDPQFYESIDPGLPLFLTNAGLLKYRNGSLKLPNKQSPVSSVSISAETRQFCESRVARRAQHYSDLENRRLRNLADAQPCYSRADKAACLRDVRERRNAESGVSEPSASATPNSISTPASVR